MRQYKQTRNNFLFFFSFQTTVTKKESWYKSWRGWYNAGRKCRNDWTDRYSGRISQVSYLKYLNHKTNDHFYSFFQNYIFPVWFFSKSNFKKHVIVIPTSNE
jgi:hypothetical protein